MSRYAFDFDGFVVDQTIGNKVSQKAAEAINVCIGNFAYNTLKRMRQAIDDYLSRLKNYQNRLGNLSASIGGCVYYNGKPYDFGTRYYGSWIGGYYLENPLYSDYPVKAPWRSKIVTGDESFYGSEVIRDYLENYPAPKKGLRVVLAVAMPYASFFNVQMLFNRFNAVNPDVKLNYIPIRMSQGNFNY